MSQRQLNILPLTPENFAPFGDVIQTQDQDFFLINKGSTRRYHQLANVDVGTGEAIISIFEATPLTYPLTIEMMERHPLGSQAFMPLFGNPYLVVVAPPTDALDPDSICAFYSNGKQGVNYHSGVWHHPVLALTPNDQFLIVDRSGEGNNCDEVDISPQQQWVLSLEDGPECIKQGSKE
ncbi:MAG: ureidoglycolate lyase [Vibrio sp.]